MVELQAYSADALTGAQIDRIPVSAFSYSRLLSAGGEGSATIPLDGTFTNAQLDDLLREWSRIIVLERDGVVEYMGYVLGESYTRGQASTTVKLGDLWSLFKRRGAWDHGAPHVEAWETTVTGNLAYQGTQAILRGRSGPPLPSLAMPVTLPGTHPGPSVTRTYYGYNVEMVADVLSDLLAEGLDIYLKPRWIGNGDTDWLYQGGPAWTSGVTHEFYVTASASDVVGFSSESDALRVTNNARYIGEGSEVDMLVRSQRDTASPYPLLDRATQVKHISDVGQLSALAGQDLITYGTPTKQWNFSVLADHPVDVGDTVRLHFDGDPRIPDGWHTRRVVKVSASVPGPDVKTIGVQPTGGA